MSAVQWERAKQILEDALRLAPARRSAFLDSACGPDGELRAEVESLIASHEQAGSQFLAAAAPEILELTPTDAHQPQISKAIGHYRLVEEIGRGGMGQVWLAEQAAPVKRRVALKLIKAGMYDDETVKRFQLERQSLAMMDHPSIAKVFETGATPEGQPYFAMEYVPGMPVTDYCDQKHLQIGERLELFIKVCGAVQHAHQKAIIHRDLKPTNILVQEIDGKPLPRIIDFGLAKAITPQTPGETLFTQFGSFVGTPGYMSPEQCDGTGLDVDTRSDVYSLGVVLYVLLTGRLPFQAKAGKELPMDEMMRLVREEDPPRPSTKVSSDRETCSAVAEARGSEPKELVSLLRGDLDWITMRALEKDRNRRYGAASELAADLARYLSHEPVMARPASLSYRVSKFVRRNRTAAALGTIAALAIIAGVAGTLLQTYTARRQRDVAYHERDRANRISELMARMFKASDPGEEGGNTVSAREILDRESQRIDSELANDSELQAQMMHLMGKAYRSLGLFARAQSLFERSIEIARRTGHLDNPQVLDCMNDLATVLFYDARFADAERLQREALAIEQRTLGLENPVTLMTMSDLSFTLSQGDNGQTGRIAEAVDLARQAFETQRRILGTDSVYTLWSMHNLAEALESGGRFAEAEKVAREALDIEIRAHGRESKSALNAMSTLGDTLLAEGRVAEAETTLQETLDIKRRVYGPQHPETGSTALHLASVLAREGRRDEAFSVLQKGVETVYPKSIMQIENDSDLASLHGDPRWNAVTEIAKQRVAAAQKVR